MRYSNFYARALGRKPSRARTWLSTALKTVLGFRVRARFRRLADKYPTSSYLRDAEFAELGRFLNRKPVPPRSLRLRGDKSEFQPRR